MLDQDAIADIEGDASAMLSQARLENDEAPSMDLLTLRLIGSKPKRMMMPREGDICPADGRWILRVHKLAPKPRARWLIGHELGEWWYRERVFASHAEREAWCDALGAALVAPRLAFRSAMGAIGHRVHVLAEAFHVPQSLALLRVGEVAGRPVALLRPAPIVRGAEFAWPAGPALARAVRRPPAGVHPVRVEERWGLMGSVA